MSQHQTKIEASYIAVARLCVTAKRLKEKASQDLLDAKRSCASLMHSVNVSEFAFQQDGEKHQAKLDRPTVKQTNVRKLYTLLGNGEITLDAFLDCMVADEQAVIETFSDDILGVVRENVKKGLDLIIT